MEEQGKERAVRMDIARDGAILVDAVARYKVLTGMTGAERHFWASFATWGNMQPELRAWRANGKCWGARYELANHRHSAWGREQAVQARRVREALAAARDRIGKVSQVYARLEREHPLLGSKDDFSRQLHAEADWNPDFLAALAGVLGTSVEVLLGPAPTAAEIVAETPALPAAPAAAPAPAGVPPEGSFMGVMGELLDEASGWEEEGHVQMRIPGTLSDPPVEAGAHDPLCELPPAVRAPGRDGGLTCAEVDELRRLRRLLGALEGIEQRVGSIDAVGLRLLIAAAYDQDPLTAFPGRHP